MKGVRPITITGKRSIKKQEQNVFFIEKGEEEKSPSSHKSTLAAAGRWTTREHFLFVEGLFFNVNLVRIAKTWKKLEAHPATCFNKDCISDKDSCSKVFH